MSDLQLVSTHEIADRLGVKVNTVHMWRYRQQLPPPDFVLGIGHVWQWATIEAWAAATGRTHFERDG